MLEYPKEGEGMEKRTIRKNDIILLIGIIGIAVICLAIQLTSPASSGNLIVQIDGVKVASYPLYEDVEFEINDGTNRVEITGGTVKMIQADCPDQICVHHKAISKNNETIVCLPNKIVLVIESTEEAEVDATTN